MTRYVLCVLVLLAALCVAVAPAIAAAANNLNPGVIPLNAKLGGLAYDDYGDLGWKWILSLPGATNPALDPTGEWAYLNQPGGPVFLLANGPVVPGQTTILERRVTIASDQALYLPLAGTAAFAAEACMVDGKCAAGLSGQEVAGYFRSVCGFATCLDGVTGLYASVDGQFLSNLFQYRNTSPQYFSCSYPEASGLAGYTGPGGTITEAAGELSVVVTDGYGLLLAPLSPGEHTLSFGASFPFVGEGTVAGVIYHVTVQ